MKFSPKQSALGTWSDRLKCTEFEVDVGEN